MLHMITLIVNCKIITKQTDAANIDFYLSLY